MNRLSQFSIPLTTADLRKVARLLDQLMGENEWLDDRNSFELTRISDNLESISQLESLLDENILFLEKRQKRRIHLVEGRHNAD